MIILISRSKHQCFHTVLIPLITFFKLEKFHLNVSHIPAHALSKDRNVGGLIPGGT